MISLRTHRSDFVAGMRAMVPWLIGVAPFGLVIGVSASRSTFPAMAGWLTGPTIYSGSPQIAVINMLNAGAAAGAVVVTALVINVRLVLYSAAIARFWRGTPLWWRLLAGYLLVDPSFVVGIERYESEPDRRRAHAHYLGGALLLWVTWLVAMAVGAVAGAGLPAWLHLEFVVPLYLIGEVVPKVRQPTARRSIAVAAVVALAGLAAPMHLGIAIAIVAGVAAGLVQHAPSTPSTQEASR